MGWFNWVPKPIKQAAKVVVGGVEKVADDVLGIDDSGGIVGSVKEIGDKVWDGLTEVGDEIKKISENPYVQMAVAIAFPQYAAFYNAAVKLNSGEELNAADIAAIAASAGQQDFAKGLNIDPEAAKTLGDVAKVATADNPGEAFLSYFGSDIAEQVGISDAFDSAVAETLGQDTLNVLKQNENYIVDSARFASGNMSEQELVAKYGAGAVDYATSGTALEDYNKYLVDALDVGVGNKTIEQVVADTYGEEIVNKLGAETPNERAIGLGGLTTATQIAMGVDPADAAYAGARRAYDEGARIDDLTWVGNQVAGIDLGLNDLVTNLGIDLPDFQAQGFDLPSIAGLGVDLNNLSITAPDILNLDMSLPEVATNFDLNVGNIDFTGYKPTDLGVDVGEWGQLKDLGVDIGQLDLGEYNLPELADLNLDLNLPELDLALQQLGQQPSQIASLAPDSDLFGDTTQFDQPEITRLSRAILNA